ncbi:uncharacterized protein LOC119088343 [Peromyscus leucopus]|uniref:uncharacterized protein LOC119088343 n=1 Tax=Peromyscus leucopus TaxID=10041 RepID=UPI001884EDE1|nr:uncharacterized protein LOC119088343 [Peromyscus leucopus]
MPTPRVRVGPRRHPPSSSHPAASAGAGASIPRGSPGRRRPLCRPHCRACAEPPRGAGPGRPRPQPTKDCASRGDRRDSERPGNLNPGLRVPENWASGRAESGQPATPTVDGRSSSIPVYTLSILGQLKLGLRQREVPRAVKHCTHGRVVLWAPERRRDAGTHCAHCPRTGCHLTTHSEPVKDSMEPPLQRGLPACTLSWPLVDPNKYMMNPQGKKHASD